MNASVKLSDLIDALQTQSATTQAYLDKRSGEIIPVSDDEMAEAEEGESVRDCPAWQRQTLQRIREIQTTDYYIQLPDQFEINEYGMMQDFCLAIEDDKLRRTMLLMIKGQGAFGRFKAAIQEFNLAESWHRYRDELLLAVARDWCRINNIIVIPEE